MKQQLDSITEQLAQQKQKLEETQRQLEAERAARAEEEAYALSRSDQLPGQPRPGPTLPTAMRSAGCGWRTPS